jgi:hypothetical protein
MSSLPVFNILLAASLSLRCVNVNGLDESQDQYMFILHIYIVHLFVTICFINFC